eukprot:3003347-Prymnesium_polylepis.1
MEEDERVIQLTSELLASDAGLRATYPVALDLSPARFQLDSLDGLAIVRHDVLRSLVLDDNALGSLNGIGRFGALRTLSAARNTIADATLSHLTRLQELNLAANRLTAVPSMVACTALQSLDLRANSISAGYDRLRTVPKLTSLLLADNRIGAGGTVEHAEFGRGLRALPRLSTLD